MANTQKVKSRFQQKIGTTQDWEQAGEKGFIPLKGEIIIYQDFEDGKPLAPKYKIGIWDGKEELTDEMKVHNLPFSSTGVELGEGENSIQQSGTEAAAISKDSIATGSSTMAGVNGYYYTKIIFYWDGNQTYDYTKGWIVLSLTQPTQQPEISAEYYEQIDNYIDQDFLEPVIRPGTSFSIINGKCYREGYECKAKVSVYKYNILQFSGDIGFTSIADPGTNTGNSNWSIFFKEYPKVGNVPLGQTAITGGTETLAAGDYSTAIGQDAWATGRNAHSEAYQGIASGRDSHSEGGKTKAIGRASHAEGYNTTASGDYAHSEGHGTEAIGAAAHSEGAASVASGGYAHAEGRWTTAKGVCSHAEGAGGTEQGKRDDTRGAHGIYSHSEGYLTKAYGSAAHAENGETFAEGDYSHTEGAFTHAIGAGAHAEGSNTVVYGDFAHAEGLGTIARGQYQHVEGRYNQEDTLLADGKYGHYAHIVGGGLNDSNRYNLHTLDWSGNAVFKGTLTASDCVTADGMSLKSVAGTATSAMSVANTAKTRANQCPGYIIGTGNNLFNGLDYGSERFQSADNGNTCNYAHIEGFGTKDKHYIKASNHSHLEGANNKIINSPSAHVQGEGNVAQNASRAFVTGSHNKATKGNQTVVGQYNQTDDKALFIVGNGSGDADEQRSNAFVIQKDGTGYLGGQRILVEGNIPTMPTDPSFTSITIDGVTLTKEKLQKLLAIADTMNIEL